MLKQQFFLLKSYIFRILRKNTPHPTFFCATVTFLFFGLIMVYCLPRSPEVVCYPLFFRCIPYFYHTYPFIFLNKFIPYPIFPRLPVLYPVSVFVPLRCSSSSYCAVCAWLPPLHLSLEKIQCPCHANTYITNIRERLVS